MLPQHPSWGTAPSGALLLLEGILAACSAHSTTPARSWQVFLCFFPFFSCFYFLEGDFGCMPKTRETLKIAEALRRYQIEIQLRFHDLMAQHFHCHLSILFPLALAICPDRMSPHPWNHPIFFSYRSKHRILKTFLTLRNLKQCLNLILNGPNYVTFLGQKWYSTRWPNLNHMLTY